MKKLIELFLTFFKIGLFTFGGGYAMISVIENECVNKKKWITKEEMQELIIIAESTPGPIAINSSTYIGYKVKKGLGSTISSISIALPSLIIIILISIFLSIFENNIIINTLFQAIRASVILLMASAFFNLFKRTQKSVLFYSLLSLSFILSFFFNVKAIYIIIFSFIYSIFYLLFTKKKEVNNA